MTSSRSHRLAFLVAVVLPGMAQASPFLLCDPYPASAGVDNFSVVIDGKPAVASTPLALADGSEKCHHDLAGLSNGQHTATVKACNQWGCSASSAPFVFSVGVPSVPTGLGITTN